MCAQSRGSLPGRGLMMNRFCGADFLCNISELAVAPKRASSSLEFVDEVSIPRQEREDLSNEIVRLLAAAQDGGSTIAECRLTLGRIEGGSWSQEWIRTARVSEARAEASFLQRNLITARRNWLRAVNYYQAAASPLDVSGRHLEAAVDGMRRCAANFVRHRSPAGEVVSIPWLETRSLQAYFLPSATPARSPVIVCIGEP